MKDLDNIVDDILDVLIAEPTLLWMTTAQICAQITEHKPMVVQAALFAMTSKSVDHREKDQADYWRLNAVGYRKLFDKAKDNP